MKNKVLAIFGIVAYILSIFTTATDLEGNYTAPISFSVISVIIMTVFIIMAVIRLWKKAKGVSITLVLATIILNILPLVAYGDLLISLFNVTKVITFITYIWVVVLLWKMAN